jgi:hypothetical protein
MAKKKKKAAPKKKKAAPKRKKAAPKRKAAPKKKKKAAPKKKKAAPKKKKAAPKRLGNELGMASDGMRVEEETSGVAATSSDTSGAPVMAKQENSFKELDRYAWDQAKNGKVKIYVMLEDLPIAGEFTEQDVIVEFPDEWSVDVTVRAGCGYRLKLGDFQDRVVPHRGTYKVDPAKNRISISLTKKTDEHWFNLLQKRGG